jgi:cytoskeletal protein RodZ
MNDLLKAVIGLIVFAILLGAFIALRSRDSAQQIGNPTSPSPNGTPASQVRSVGQTTQRSTNQPASSVPANQTGTAGTTTTTTTTQSGGTTATGTAGSSAGSGATTTAPSAAGAGSKPVPALW